MDQPFPSSQWRPSRRIEVWEQKHSSEQLTELIHQLNSDTITISQYPYDPTSWLSRALTLELLRYPELAVGDAHKTILLCRNVIDRPSGYRLGYRNGFWMKGDTNRFERETQRQKVDTLQKQAYDLIARNLDWPEKDEGRCVLLPYPWMRDEHLWRSDEVVDALNKRFADPENRAEGVEQACELRRYAFGKGVGARDGADLLGVFATRDIAKDEVVIIDESDVWGCNGPGQNGSTANLYGDMGCGDALHPNAPDDPYDFDLRWVRDRCGKKAADVLLKCRFLLRAVLDNVKHPLDHPVIAGLTPTYRKDEFRDYSLETDIVVLNEAMQKFGVDIFANQKWDTWILFVLMARFDNNSWSDPNASCISSMFSMLNHSCDPNIEWSVPEDHQTMYLRTARDIHEGEQLFICYDGFMRDQSLQARRERFWRWLDSPCQCTRCINEETEEMLNGDMAPNCNLSNSASGDWDTDEKPTLPEDTY